MDFGGFMEFSGIGQEQKNNIQSTFNPYNLYPGELSMAKNSIIRTC